MDLKYLTADERESLYNEVWAEPVTTVAKRYDISDNGLRKHCKRLGIPLPPPGYWARIAAGQKVPQTALPKVTGELKNYIRQYVIKYKPDLEQLTDAELTNEEEFNSLREETKAFIRETCAQVQVKGQLRNSHKLITEHKEECVYRKKRDKALGRARFSSRYYASEKSRYRDNKPILPISVSESNMNRAYRILDTIIKTIADMEGHTRVGSDSGKDTGCFIVLYTSFFFELREETRKKSASSKGNEQPPNLVLSLSPKSWFRDNTADKMEYRDGVNALLESQVGRIIYDMFLVANKLRIADIIDEREEERRWEEEERQRRLEQMRKGELEEVELLVNAASDWGKAEKIRRFANCMEQKVAEINDESKKKKLYIWLKWARDKADWLDPLVTKEDEVLGKSRHIFDSIDE
jgi:hypothetical protein